MNRALLTWCWLGLLLGACDGPIPTFSKKTIDATVLGKELPPGFLLGTATSSHQSEGGESDDWTDWELGAYPDGRPHIKNHDTAQIADGSWTRWQEDHAKLQELGANAYRFSVEWSRLEPTEGAWDTAAAANYRAQLEALRARGITPVLTIHHYTFPRWVAAKGGWEWSGIADALGALAGRVGAEYGDLVDFYCTINEPNVATFEAYLWGSYPPGVQDAVRTAHAYVATLHAHAAMAAALRASDTVDADGDRNATRIGMAINMLIFEPATGSAQDAALAGLNDDIFDEMVPRAVKTGLASIHLPGVVDLDEEVPGLVGSFDYLGLNYYSRELVRLDLSQDSLASNYSYPGTSLNTVGSNSYPEGLYRLLKREARWGLPIYILENGTCGDGSEWPDYLRAHVYAMVLALREHVDVRGYFVWSLLDNFEWSDGYASRCGLYKVDVTDPDLVRQPTAGVGTYQQIAREAGLLPP